MIMKLISVKFRFRMHSLSIPQTLRKDKKVKINMPTSFSYRKKMIQDIRKYCMMNELARKYSAVIQASFAIREPRKRLVVHNRVVS